MTHSITRRRAAGLLGATLVTALARPALAETYPSRPVKMIVPFPAGNMADLLARMVADEMFTRFGQTVVVDNRAGASGVIGIQAAARSPADGYTLLMASSSSLVVYPALAQNLPFDVRQDLQPIALIGGTPYVFIAPNELPARTLGEAVELFRRNPGKYTAANSGTGTFGHLITEQFCRAAGIKMEHVPYRGSGQALVDMQAGRIHLMLDAMTSSLPQIQAGRLRGLAVLSEQRSAIAPEIPTVAEAGMPGLNIVYASGWAGLLAPSHTPPDVVAYWDRQINVMLSDPAFQKRLRAQNYEAAAPGTPSGLGDLIRRELPRFAAVAHEAGIQLNE
ncbi:Bug family tripartite tricarboxylate transporter substrate binding protein [Pseudoroseomonas wenyumeiae]